MIATENSQTICEHCKAPITKNADMCPKCGCGQFGKDSQPDGKKTKTVAAVLAFFLGGLGAHKFYLGKPLWGCLYILFVWTYVPSVIAFFEFLVILMTPRDEFDKEYNKKVAT